MSFRDVDRLRLLFERIEKFINVEALLAQDALTAHFPAHCWSDIERMSHGWGNQRLWTYIPTRDVDDVVRDYFGEKVAWMFVWQSFYARCLLVPAALGSLFFLTPYIMSVYAQDLLQISFAFLMAFWVMWFNVSYMRYERRVQTRWGHCFFDEDASVRDEYKPELHKTWRIKLTKVSGHILGFFIVFLVMVCTWGLHIFRQYLEKNEVTWIFSRLAAILITLQILVLDRVWLVMSKWIVDHENHQTQAQWNASWVQKLFFVRIFSNLFPFLFLSIRRHLPGQICPQTSDL